MQNKDAPHKTVIWIKAITYEVLQTGELSGIPVQKREMILKIDGENQLDCLSRTNEYLEELKNAQSKSKEV